MIAEATQDKRITSLLNDLSENIAIGETRRLALFNFSPSILGDVDDKLKFKFVHSHNYNTDYLPMGEVKKTPTYLVIKKVKANRYWLRIVHDPKFDVDKKGILSLREQLSEKHVFETILGFTKLDEFFACIEIYGPTWLPEVLDVRRFTRLNALIHVDFFEEAPYKLQERRTHKSNLPAFADQDNPTFVNIVINYEKRSFLVNYVNIHDASLFVKTSTYSLMDLEQYLRNRKLWRNLTRIYGKVNVETLCRFDHLPENHEETLLVMSENKGIFV